MILNRWWLFPVLLVATGWGWAKPLPDLIDSVRPSVVAVGTYSPSGSPPAKFRGTGFVVGNGLQIVTNLHVLPETLDSKHFEQLAIFVGRPNSRVEWRIASVQATDPEHDLALLKVLGAPFTKLVLKPDSVNVREGDEIAFTGFPLGMVLGLHPVTHHGIVSAITPVVTPVAQANRLTAKVIQAARTPYDVLQLDATAFPGNSGSPVYETESGDVIGIVNMVYVKGSKESALSDPSGITYAIPVRFIEKLLQDANGSDPKK